MIEQKKILEALKEFSSLENSIPPASICITDEHGFVLAYLQMDGSSSRSFTMARAKACTAARMGITTADFHKRLIHEHLTISDFGEEHFTSVQGGIPLQDKKGRIIGGIGISGMSPEQDEALAKKLALHLL